MSVVLSGQCQHLTYTTNIGPTTDQQNHTCAACGHFWTTFPARSAVCHLCDGKGYVPRFGGGSRYCEACDTRQAQAQGSGGSDNG